MNAKQTITGTEYCPFCERDTDFDVAKDVWIVNCSHCGRPIVLCDKCYSMFGYAHQNCENCVWAKKAEKMRKKWEKNQIGKIVYWHDPDENKCSDFCRIVGFNNGAYVLDHVFDKDVGGEIEALESEIDILTEDVQEAVRANAVPKNPADPSSRRRT